MLRRNLLYTKIGNYEGFMDTGGGTTFKFREGELKIKFIETKELDFLPKKVIVFIGNDYWRNKIYLFDYVRKRFGFINTIPKLPSYKMYNKKMNYAHFKIELEGKEEMFLFDTGATLTKDKKNSAISFLDGAVFDKLKNKYKTINNYDDDGSPCIIIPILIFNTITKAKFLRRKKGAFTTWMSNLTGIAHIGAIGGNVLRHFKIIADYKNKRFYV